MCIRVFVSCECELVCELECECASDYVCEFSVRTGV